MTIAEVSPPIPSDFGVVVDACVVVEAGGNDMVEVEVEDEVEADVPVEVEVVAEVLDEEADGTHS